MLQYKVKHKAPAAQWRPYKTGCLEVSMSPNYPSGEKLESIFEWMYRNFENRYIYIGDTLQKHNLIAEGSSPEEAYKKAEWIGKSWLFQSKSLIQNYDFDVIKWDDVLSDPLFPEYLSYFTKAYNKCTKFRDVVMQDVVSFYGHGEIDAHKIQCSVDFILEEVAGDSVLAHQMPYAGVYPGSNLNTIQAIYNGSVLGRDLGIRNLSFLPISMIKRKKLAN